MREQRTSSDTESSSAVPTPKQGVSPVHSALDLQQANLDSEQPSRAKQVSVVSHSIFAKAEGLKTNRDSSLTSLGEFVAYLTLQRRFLPPSIQFCTIVSNQAAYAEDVHQPSCNEPDDCSQACI